MLFYHGSSLQDLKTLSPNFNINKPSDIKDNYIFLTKDKKFAACYGGTWNDSTARQGYFNGVLYFAPSDKVIMTNPCSLYIVESDDAKKITSHQYITKKDVIVKKEIKYSSFKEMLIKNKVNIITVEEYLEKLTEYNG